MVYTGGCFQSTGLSTSNGALCSMTMIKADNNGALKWAISYGGTTFNEFLNGMALTSNEEVLLVCGSIEISATNSHFFISKHLTSNGAILFFKKFGGTDY